MDTCNAQAVNTNDAERGARCIHHSSNMSIRELILSFKGQHHMPFYDNPAWSGLLTRKASAASCNALTAATCHRLSFSVLTDSVISRTSL